MPDYRTRPVEDLLVTEFLYRLYCDDPKISTLLDEYITGVPLALHDTLIREPDADPEKVVSRLRADVFERIVAAIWVWIWVKFPALRQDCQQDRATVDEFARARASELTGRLSASRRL